MLFACACGEKTGNFSSDSTPSEPKYSLNQTLQKLQKDEYADTSLTDTLYGLNDPSSVGVIKSEFSQTLYPIPADEAFDGEIIRWDTYQYEGDNFGKFKAILDEAKTLNAQGKKVKLNMPEKETIDLDITNSDDGHFAIKQADLNGFYLQGNGCEFNLQYPDLEWRGFLYFNHCDDVWLENFTVDYEVPNTVFGTVLSYDEEKMSATIEVDPECNPFIRRLEENKGTVWSYLEYNKTTLAPKEDGNYIANGEKTALGYAIDGNENSGYTLTVRFHDEVKRFFNTNSVGHFANVAFSYYVYNCLTFDACGSSYVENVTLYASPAMGFVGRNSQNICLNRFNLMRKENSNRLMTCNADGIHIEQARGEVKVTNGVYEYMQDDALNLKAGYWYEFSDYSYKNKTITISKKTNEMTVPQAGDVLEIYDQTSFEFKGSLTVESAEGTPLAYTITVKESLAKIGVGTWKNCVVTNTASAKLTFRNNIVRNKRNRGVLVQTREGLVENNSFENVAHGSIIILSFLDQFNEATVPADIVIRNNKLVNNLYALQSSPAQGDILVSAQATEDAGFPGTIKNITVENNFIAKNGNVGICFRGVGNSTIKNNLFYNNARVYADKECSVWLYNSGEITVKDNYRQNTLSKTCVGVMSGGATNPERISLNGNYDLELSDGTEFLERETVEVIKLSTGKLTVDGNLSDWLGIGSSVTVKGGSYYGVGKAKEEDYIEHFGLESGKIAWDDTGVYIAFEVRDDQLVFEKIENFWYGDCFELLMTAVDNQPDGDMQKYKNDDDTLQLVCVPAWEKGFDLHTDRTSTDIYARKSEIQAKVVYTDKGYAGEIFLPFTLFDGVKAQIDAGKSVTFNMVFMDAERAGKARLSIANVPHNVENTKKRTESSVQYTFVEGK